MQHVPVLVDEVLELLAPSKDSTLLDLTIGHGGHTKAWLTAAGPEAGVVGFDADAAALKEANENLKEWEERVTLINNNFWQVQDSLEEAGGGILKEFTHVLFDLGIGSHQLDDYARGFSFQGTGTLSMRYGTGDTLPPAKVDALNALERRLGFLPNVPELLQRLSETELAQVIRTYGEERYARRIAEALATKPVPESGQALAERIVAAVPRGYERGRLHPATRTFQALRLAVNRELETLAATLPQVVQLLAPDGLVGVISFHSLEDRIVKQFFRTEATDCLCPPEQVTCVCDHEAQLRIVTKRPRQATQTEIDRNPRARSAKLRVAQKLAHNEQKV